MAFPETRRTLIHRIATSADEECWRQFLGDYWRPVYRFAARWGDLGAEDAEDVASATFEVIVRKQLLARWLSNRTSKLRTLLCGVVRNVIANQARVRAGRTRLLREHGGELDGLIPADGLERLDTTAEQDEAFYAAWAEELLQAAVDALMQEYYREGRGDYFRVLYGRVCEGMTMPEIAHDLDLKLTDVENYLKHARKRLAESLERQLRQHVQRYTAPEELQAEFAREWGQLGEFLKARGGLEAALRRSSQDLDSAEARRRQSTSMTTILTSVRDRVQDGPTAE